MASADNLEEVSFLSHVGRVGREVHAMFERAHKILLDREADLLAELQRLVDDYTGDGVTQQITELSLSKDGLRGTLKENENKEFLKQQLGNTNTRIAELETKLQTAKDTYKSVSLEWDIELYKKLSVAGEIRLNSVREGIRDYKAIGDPVAVFGEHSSEKHSPGLFHCPEGIAINPDNNYIYICNSRFPVQVYNNSFGFVFQFGGIDTDYSLGICIKQKRVYITAILTHCLTVYSTEGKFLNSVGVEGRGELEFNNPRGLDISTDQDRIYIAEISNNRIQCLNLDLGFNSFIEINAPRDVKLTSDEIVVLSSRNPWVSLYSYSHQLIREMISKCEGNPIVPTFFTLDTDSNILITDYTVQCVYVFSFKGELIHRFGKEGEERGEFIHPSGITIDTEGRILVVSKNPKHCIQVF